MLRVPCRQGSQWTRRSTENLDVQFVVSAHVVTKNILFSYILFHPIYATILYSYVGPNYFNIARVADMLIRKLIQLLSADVSLSVPNGA